MQEAIQEFVIHSLREVERIVSEQGNLQLGEFFSINKYVQNLNFINEFNSKQKRTKYFEKEINVLMPKKRILGKRFVKHGSAKTNEERPTKLKVDEMYFVPLSKVLRNFSKNPTYADILDNHTSKPGILASFRDISKYETQKWRQDNYHHNILLYMDDGLNTYQRINFSHYWR